MNSILCQYITENFLWSSNWKKYQLSRISWFKFAVITWNCSSCLLFKKQTKIIITFSMTNYILYREKRVELPCESMFLVKVSLLKNWFWHKCYDSFARTLPPRNYDLYRYIYDLWIKGNDTCWCRFPENASIKYITYSTFQQMAILILCAVIARWLGADTLHRAPTLTNLPPCIKTFLGKTLIISKITIKVYIKSFVLDLDKTFIGFYFCLHIVLVCHIFLVHINCSYHILKYENPGNHTFHTFALYHITIFC